MKFGPQNLFDQLDDRDLEYIRAFFCGATTLRDVAKQMPVVDSGTELVAVAMSLCVAFQKELMNRNVNTLELHPDVKPEVEIPRTFIGQAE